MRIFIIFILSMLLFTSCFDMSMKVEVDQAGAIQYEGDFDLSSMMPLMMMAMEMAPDTTGEEDAFTELLKSGSKIDSIMGISEMENGLDPNDDLVKKMDEQFKLRLQVEQSAGIFKLSLRASFDDMEMQREFGRLVAENKGEGSSGILGGMEEGDEAFDAIFINQLDLEKGFLVYKTILKEETEGDDMGGNPFAPTMEPTMKVHLTVPGKIKSIEGAEYQIINAWTAEIKIPLETTDPAKEFVKINFEPRSIFTRPEVTEQWEPIPEKVTFEGKYHTPSDAIVLIGEKGPEGWEHVDGSEIKWEWDGETLTVKPGTGDIRTVQKWGDCQLHVEWRTPLEKGKRGQEKGNSGVFLQSRYEVQVLDSYENATYPNGQAGSIYKQYIPDVNASKAPGEWQVYDIIYQAPRFNDLGGKDESARITVIHNGVLIHDNREIKGTTEYIGLPKNMVHGDAPLKLQDHTNEVSYRNVWVRKL